ncbi:g11548 [Coccomyxa elongata]
MRTLKDSLQIIVLDLEDIREDAAAAFEVQQVKKVSKFSCRLCGAKQSVQQVYAISGKAADVRGVVTGLNAKRQQQEEARDQALINSLDNDSDLHDEQQRDTAQPAIAWEDYLEKEVVEDPAGAQAQRLKEDAACYVTELPNGPQGKRKAKTAASGEMIRKSGKAVLAAVTWVSGNPFLRLSHLPMPICISQIMFGLCSQLLPHLTPTAEAITAVKLQACPAMSSQEMTYGKALR